VVTKETKGKEGADKGKVMGRMMIKLSPKDEFGGKESRFGGTAPGKASRFGSAFPPAERWLWTSAV